MRTRPENLKAIRPVYTYYFPEIRRLVDTLVNPYPHEVYLKSVQPGLDDYHLPVMDHYQKYYTSSLSGLEGFTYRYASSGSSEAIFHLLVYLKVNQPASPIYVLEGEYEGYQEYGANVGLKIQPVDLDKTVPQDLPRGYWFISNPSARDGGIIPNNLIQSLADAGHKIIFDGSYVGLTAPYRFDLTHPNIVAYLASLSKPYGVFYYRAGFAWTRFEVKTLYPNIWFKNIFSLILAEGIFNQFTPNYFYDKYSPFQKEVLNQIKEETGLSLTPSQVIFLANRKVSECRELEPEVIKVFEKFRRGPFYRFCLTPYYLEAESKFNDQSA